MKGINFKRYYKLFCKLNDGDTEGMERREYREKLFAMLSDDLEKNFIDGHITDIEQVKRSQYTCKLVIEYTGICSGNISKMYIILMEECFYINGLYIKY